MSTARISRWARRFLLVAAAFLVASQVAFLLDAAGVGVTLGLYGFVLTTVFGKGYSLVPSYFDRSLSWPTAPAVHLPLWAGGVVALGVARLGIGPALSEPIAGLCLGGGVAVFLATMLVTARDNLTGRETGTGNAEARRASLDRFANAFVPIALAYLALGTYEGSAAALSLPTLLDGSGVQIAHLLGPGFALLMLFAIGYRLLPRFLSATVPEWLAVVVLPLGALGPALLAWGYPAGTAFRAGAAAESIAVVGFAASYALLFHRSERRRIGFYGPLAGVGFGCLGVAIGAWFAFRGIEASLIGSHFRANVFGLLGLSIVGVVFQFYPPAVGTWPGASDRSAVGVLAALVVGLTCVVVAPLTVAALATVGSVLFLVGALGYLYLLASSIRYQATRR